MNLAIGSDKIKKNLKKQNLITFMPRKLPMHSQKLIFLLRNKLPNNWKIKPLANISDTEFYNYLKKSKLFLSFSYMEGLGAPPIEAAKEGNKVIGYTGEGGKDYWKKPIFTEIYSGDIRNFVRQVIKKVAEINSNNKLKQKQYRSLANNFSKENEIHHIKKFLNYIS